MYKKKPSNVFLNKNRFNNSINNNKPINIQNEYDFPMLGKKIDNSTVSGNTHKNSNYSKMVQTEMDLIENKKKHDIPEGFVVAKFDKNRIIIEIDSRMEARKREIIELNDRQFIEKTHFNMVNRWQKERDNLNDLLGTESPYWDSINLFEFDEEELNEDYFNNDENENDDEEEELEIEELTYNDELY
jgi:hypothetical protein